MMHKYHYLFKADQFRTLITRVQNPDISKKSFASHVECGANKYYMEENSKTIFKLNNS